MIVEAESFYFDRKRYSLICIEICSSSSENVLSVANLVEDNVMEECVGIDQDILNEVIIPQYI